MQSKENCRITKGMIFAGCSFTWGQGLYYYSNLPTIGEPPPDQYDPKLVKHAHIKFMESVRYPRIVADHFNSFEFVHPQNGGSNEGAVTWWTKCFTDRSEGAWYSGHSIPFIEYEEVSHVVFQLTQWQRDHVVFEHSGKTHYLPFHEINKDEHKQHFLKYLEDQGLSLDQFLAQYIQKGLDNVKQFLQTCESKGIKTLIFTWPEEYIPLIEQDPWLSQRFVTFNYNGKNYKSITDLMWPGAMHSKGYNPELTVKWDEFSFEVTPKDHHPSLTCHRVMAQNIIRRIENDNNNNATV